MGSPIFVISPSVRGSGQANLRGTPSFTSSRQESTVAARVQTFVACADPATPMAFTPKPPQMNSGSSTTLRATQTTFTIRTGLSSATPLKPDASTPLAVSGIMPQARPFR